MAVGTLSQTLDAMKEMVCLPIHMFYKMVYVGFAEKSV